MEVLVQRLVQRLVWNPVQLPMLFLTQRLVKCPVPTQSANLGSSRTQKFPKNNSS